LVGRPGNRNSRYQQLALHLCDFAANTGSDLIAETRLAIGDRHRDFPVIASARAEREKSV
jgi:hypothetical protein